MTRKITTKEKVNLITDAMLSAATMAEKAIRSKKIIKIGDTFTIKLKLKVTDEN